MKKYFVIWGLLLAVLVVMVFVSEMVSPEVRIKLVKEGGLVENTSWIAYFVAAVFVLLQTRRWPVRWSMLVCTLLLGMRELDLDKEFTTMGIFKSRFYSSTDVPVVEKLIAGVITIAIVATLFFLIKNHLKPFLIRLKNREGASLSFLFAGGMLVFAKSIDGFSRKLEPFSIESSAATNRVMESIEESFEMCAALLIVVAAVGALRQRSK